MKPKSLYQLERPEYDRAIFEVLHALRDMTDKEIAAKCFVSVQTVRKLRMGPRHGGTRFPLHVTLSALARVAGLDWRLVETAVVDRERSRINAPEPRMMKEQALAHHKRMTEFTQKFARKKEQTDVATAAA